jgi:lipopolysaccharide transport system ATP-binding protein
METTQPLNGQQQHLGNEKFQSNLNMQAILTLTRKCIVLSRGLCTFAGETGSATRHYLNDARSVESLYVDKPSPTEPKVTRVEVRTTEPNNVQTHGGPMEVRLQISTPVTVRGAWLSFRIVNDLQQPFVHLWTSDSENPMCREPGVYQLICRIPKTRLYLGKYTITLYLSEPPGGRLFQMIEGICPFEVVMHSYYREYRWEPGTCAYLEDCNWEPVQRLTQLSLGAAQLAQV